MFKTFLYTYQHPYVDKIYMYLQYRGMTHLRGMPVCGISKRSVSEKDPSETSRFISPASKKKTQEKHE